MSEYSPIVHKVIEHVHSILQREFWKQLREDANIVTFQQHCKILKNVFYRLRQGSMKRGVKSLSSIFEVIKLIKRKEKEGKGGRGRFGQLA